MAVADSELIADILGIKLSELATLVGVTKKALTAESDALKVDQALHSLARILTMAIEMTGEKSRAALWFRHQPIPGWAGKTAYDLVRMGHAGKVLSYLEAVRSGAYA